MFQTGYLTVFRYKGTPVRFHWSAPLGALFFGGFAFLPGFWVGFVLLILIHEMGHALLVRRVGLRAVAIEVHGLGGQCRYAGYPDPLQRSIVAWGGVLAQAVLGAVTLGVLVLVGWPPAGSLLSQLVSAFTWTNLWIIGLNLLPFRPLDGAEAWKLFGLLRGRKPRPPKPKKRSKVDVERGVAVVDDGEVRETIRDALARAQREAADKRRQKN